MRARSLTPHAVSRKDDPDLRAAVRACHGHLAAERSRTLGDRVEAGAAPLAGGVVPDHELDPFGALADRDRDALRRAPPDRLVERDADDLEDRDLRVLREL